MSDDSTDSTGESRKSSVSRRALAFTSAIVALAVALVVVTVRGGSTQSTHGPVTIIPSPGNLGVWDLSTITSPGLDRSEPSHEMIYTAGEFRVTSKAANQSENRREVWSFDRNFGDVDVTARLEKPSEGGDGFRPQPGIAIRFSDDGKGSGRALIVDANIWSGALDQLMVGVWSWPASTPTGIQIDSIGHPLLMQSRAVMISGVRRSVDANGHARDLFSVTPADLLGTPNGFEVGDHVDISTGVDTSYAQTDAIVTVADAKIGLIEVRHDGPAKATGFANEFGAIRFHYDPDVIAPKSLYPRWVRVRVIGRTARVKSWLVGSAEPDWQLTTGIDPRLRLPSEGKVGLVANHLHGAGRYIAFGDVTIDPIEHP